MSVGDQIEGFYLLQAAFEKTTFGGKPFLSMVLADSTGTIEAQIWDYTGPVTPKDTGVVVIIRGAVSEFKGTMQITVEHLRLANNNDKYNICDLVPTAPIDVEVAWRELQDIVESIEDRDYLV